ncbi:PREDICTED: uncharacterized protein LOC109240027 [Nicotiana attenuata]|uniref:Uncharacterized protein n=1 Tax=Nicotiana attenuata TaxID=49451 RepID=A0A314LA55_NICAT|nr:PREDICTED: uncharacterized protein LOC109240027 [Nicotiana attenuata]OIT37997.1 hypothetical protein A4A49_27234 [Nicotiana attenuata]
MNPSTVEEFEKKVVISERMSMEEEAGNCPENDSFKIVELLRRFLAVQQRRAQAYARLKRGFEDFMVSGVESTYQKLCSEITVEFGDCSKQVLEMESQFLTPHCFREDLAHLLRSVQNQEKSKLQLTATIQVLKKAGRPSERLVSHENCRYSKPTVHECVHIQKITEASGTEEAEADAEFDNALKEAIQGVQDAVTTINEHLEEVRYEIAALEE